MWSVSDTIAFVGQAASLPWSPGQAGSLPHEQFNNVGDSVSLAVSATDAYGSPLTYSASGLPAGVTIDSTSGLISGTPTQSGFCLATVTASDTTYSASQTFGWSVAGAIQLTDPGSQLSYTGTTVSLQLQATDSLSGATLTYSASGLPSGPEHEFQRPDHRHARLGRR